MTTQPNKSPAEHPLLAPSSKHYPECPFCGVPLEKREGKFGDYRQCPFCTVIASKSPQDGRIYITTQTGRDLRKAAHAVFDLLWQEKHMSRKGAYRWLQKQLGLTSQQCHMKHLNRAGCRLVIEAATAELVRRRSGVKEDPM